MKIKHFFVIVILATAILCSAGFVSAQTTQTQASLTQQLIQLLTQMITQLEQEIQQILAQQHTSTPTNCIPAGGAYAAPLTSSDLCCSGLVEHPTTQSGTVGICVLPSTQSSITITSPASGETITIGQNYQIKWAPVNSTKVNVLLETFDQNGNQIGNAQYLAQAIDNSGVYNWTPSPSLVATYKYRIEITKANALAFDASDSGISNGYFTIIAPATTSNWQSVSEFGFSIKYPNDWNLGNDVMSITLDKKIGSGSLQNGNPFNDCSLDIMTIGARNTATDFNNFIQQNYNRCINGSCTAVPIQSTQQVSVNGMPATEITNCNQNGCWTNYWIYGGAGKYSFQITTQTQTTTITQSSGVNVGMSSYVDIPECDNTFNQMLSTFTTTD